MTGKSEADEAKAMIEQALKIARDLADGKVTPAEVTAATIAECRALVGSVHGPGDECWPLQVEIARGVLAHDGIETRELGEWLAVARLHAGPPRPWIEETLARLGDDDDDESQSVEPL